MKFEILLNGKDLLLEYRIRDAMGKTIQELNKRNILTSGFAADDIISSGFLELNNQIILTFDDFSKMKLLKKSEVLILKRYIDNSIDMLNGIISIEAQKRTNFEPNTLKLDFLKNEAKKNVDLHTERFIREIKFRSRNLGWEIVKIAFTAIIAGFIGGYIKDIFF